MTEPKKGEPVTTPPEENVTPPAPEKGVFPEGHKFYGKTQKEVAEAYEELEKKQGQSAKEYGELKANRDSYQSAYDSLLAQQQAAMKAATQQSPTEQTPKEELYAEERGIAKEESQKMANQIRFESALKMAPFAKDNAKQRYPHLFEGDKEQKVTDLLMGSVRQGVINPDVVANPESWAMAAHELEGRSTGYKPLASPQTMTPGQTEVPSATKPPMTEGQADVPWGATAQSMWEKIGSEAFGGKKEDLTKAVQEGMAEEERLAK